MKVSVWEIKAVLQNTLEPGDAGMHEGRMQRPKREKEKRSDEYSSGQFHLVSC